MGRYDLQLIRYVFDTDIDDTLRTRNNKNVHHLRFQNKEFWISTSKMFWVDLYNATLVLKQNDHLCSVYHRFIHKVLVQHN